MSSKSRLFEDHLGLEAESDVRALGVSRSRAWTLTFLAMLALSVTLVDRQALAALAVAVTDSLGISNVEYGWLSSAFAGAYLIGSLPAARMIQRIGPRWGLAASVTLASLVIGVHGAVGSFATLLALRVGLGLSIAPAFACAVQTVHFVLPFKSRARGIGMLYMGNSLGSALCAPLSVTLASVIGWRGTFVWVAVIGLAWVPLWILTAFAGEARTTLDSLRPPPPGASCPTPSRKNVSSSLSGALGNPAAVRAVLVVAAAAPVTTVMLIWGAKYLASEHGLHQSEVGRYLWLPALLFGAGSLLFGELRALSARTRARTRPPRLLMVVAAMLATSIAAVPLAHGPRLCIVVASVAMMGSGGLYMLATSDILAHTGAGTVPVATGLTTITQSFVYIVVSPIIGKAVEHFGNYDWVMTGAGLWVLPGCAYWLAHVFVRGSRPSGRAQLAE